MPVMIRFLALLVATASAIRVCGAQPQAKVETQKVVFENPYVRVIEERVPPGVGQPKHRHARGILVPLASTTIEAVDYPEGRVAQRELKFGEAGWRDPVVHAVRNIGQMELLNIRVELR